MTHHGCPEGQDTTELLRARLGMLLQDVPVISGRTRVLTQNVEALDPFAAILAEISETLQPRRLLFRNDQGGQVGVDVSSGRVLRLAPESTHGFVTGIDSETLQALARSVDRQEHALSRMLRAFSDNAEQIAVESLPPENMPSALEVGVLPEILTLPPEYVGAKAVSEGISGFLNTCRPFVRAGLLVEGETTHLAYGPEGDQQALRALAQSEQSETAQFASEEAPQGPPLSAMIYAGHPIEGAAVLCLAKGALLGFLSFANPALPEVLEAWKKAAPQ